MNAFLENVPELGANITDVPRELTANCQTLLIDDSRKIFASKKRQIQIQRHKYTNYFMGYLIFAGSRQKVLGNLGLRPQIAYEGRRN